MASERERTIDRALAVPVGEESAQLRELFSTDATLLMKSELTPGLIIPLARAYVIAGITGSKVLKRYCVPGKTKILVKNDKYCGAQGTSGTTNKKAMDVSIDDHVLTYNEGTSEKEFKKVQHVYVRNVSSLTEFTFSNGNFLECTAEHPIAVVDDSNCLIWKKAQDVSIGDKVIQIRYKGLNGSLSKKGKTYEQMYGMERSRQVREKQSAVAKRNCENPDVIEMKRRASSKQTGVAKLGLRETLSRVDVKQKMSARTTEQWKDDKIRAKRQNGISKAWRDGREKWMRTFQGEKYLQKRSEISKSIWSNKPYRERMRTIHAEKWKDADYREMMGPVIEELHRKSRNGIGKSKSEEHMLDILERNFANEWIYVGSGEFWIDRINPDFVNSNGKKKFIDLLGCYWHGCPECGFEGVGNSVRPDGLGDRSNRLSNFGYEILYVWEHELSDENKIVDRVREFSYNPNIEIISVLGKKEKSHDGQVYDFLVEDNHNFFAEGILVHNCDLILQAQISKDRKGRMELMEALIAGRRTTMDDDDY